MSKEKKVRVKVARRSGYDYYERQAAREAAQAERTKEITAHLRSQTMSFERLAQAMERIANSLEPLKICTCTPKTKRTK